MKFNLLKSSRAALLVPLTVLSLVTATQAQGVKPMAASASMPMSGMHSGVAGSADMKTSMMGGMDSMQKMQMSGDTDKDYAMLMKIHPQGALEMAQMELAHGKSPAMKAMAKNIIAAQKKEIAQFDQWLATQK